jgi:hypothetical protein
MKDQLCYSHLSSHVHWRLQDKLETACQNLASSRARTHTHTHNLYVYSKTDMQRFIAFLTGTTMSQLN